MRGHYGWVIAAMLLFLALPAHADCRQSWVNGSFGSQSSFVINSTVQNTSTSFTVDCDAVVSLLTSDSVKLTYLGATPGTSGTRALLRRTDDPTNTDSVPIIVCVQSGCSGNSEVQIKGTYTWSGTTLLNLLANKRYTLPLYLRTVAGQNISAGTYNVVLNFRIDWNVCNLGVAACLGYQSGSGAVDMALTLTVTNDCTTISAPAVNFDSAPLVQNFKSVSQSIAITCTKGSSYTVGINNGLNVLGTVRRMKSGNNFMSYEIYKANGTDRWGGTGAERWASAASSGLSSDGLLRNYNYVAQVLTNQTTPPAGNYTDTLVVDVTF